MTQLEKLYNLYSENGELKNNEIADMMHLSEGAVKVFKNRLKRRGMIDTDENGHVNIIAPYTAGSKPSSEFKQAVYEEMINAYMDDFRSQSTFRDRLAVGREVRLLLERI